MTTLRTLLGTAAQKQTESTTRESAVTQAARETAWTVEARDKALDEAAAHQIGRVEIASFLASPDVKALQRCLKAQFPDAGFIEAPRLRLGSWYLTPTRLETSVGVAAKPEDIQPGTMTWLRAAVRDALQTYATEGKSTQTLRPSHKTGDIVILGIYSAATIGISAAVTLAAGPVVAAGALAVWLGSTVGLAPTDR